MLMKLCRNLHHTNAISTIPCLSDEVAGLQDALDASRGTLLEVHNVVVAPVPRGPVNSRQLPPPSPSLERFRELHNITLRCVHDARPWSVPLLPVSLRALTLDAGPETLKDAPSWLRLAHLTRLAELTLCDHASFLPLCAEIEPEGDGPPLPASLAALRLESLYPIDLGELVARGGIRLTAAASTPVLSALSAVVCCSLDRLPRGSGGNVADVGAEPVTDRLVSKLPAGFGALQVCAQCITIKCSVALLEAGPEDAARELCLFFDRAPASYRRFSVLWMVVKVPLQFRLSWPLGIADPGGTALARQGRVAFDSVEALAECMQIYAAALRMKVIVSEEPMRHLSVVRT